MTLNQALRLCDALEGLVRKGHRDSSNNSFELTQIHAAFTSNEDPYVEDRAARAVAETRQYLEAPPSHIRLLGLRRSALTAVSRLRAAILLSQDSVVRPGNMPPVGVQAPPTPAARVL